jgi:hypothetical protein
MKTAASVGFLCVLVALAGGCASMKSPDPSNTAQYCTPENAFRLGTQAQAYFGGCPKQSEGTFLASLERGRAIAAPPPSAYPYFVRMGSLEKQLIAAGSDTERAPLRTQLADAQWWANHLYYCSCSYFP